MTFDRIPGLDAHVATTPTSAEDNMRDCREEWGDEDAEGEAGKVIAGERKG